MFCRQGRCFRGVLRVVGVSLVLMLLIGCAYLNEGAINYRKSVLAKENDKNERYLNLMSKYVRASPEKESAIRKNDSISIHLEQVYIKDFYEIPAFWRGETSKDLRGEIAIVVRAFELTEGQDLDFRPSAVEAGRLVYYSDDVRKGQFLNFSYLPVYGPITYKGNPIVLQIYILELDTGTEKLKPLLSTLARAGANVYPPASPVLSLIETLGSAFLSGNKDDVLFRYSLVLHPNQGYADMDYPILEAGQYVFLRKEDRLAPEDWDRIKLDQEDGRLVLTTSPASQATSRNGGSGELYRDETYAVLAIQKGFDPTSLDLAQNTFGEFLTRLETDAAKDVSNLDVIVKKLAADQKRIRDFGELRRTVQDLSRLSSTETDKRSRLSNKMLDALAAQIDKEKECQGGTPDSEKCRGAMAPDEIDYLLSKIRGLVKDPGVAAMVSREDLKKEKGKINEAIVKGK